MPIMKSANRDQIQDLKRILDAVSKLEEVVSEVIEKRLNQEVSDLQSLEERIESIQRIINPEEPSVDPAKTKPH